MEKEPRDDAQFGWKPERWARAVDLSRASVYNLLAAKRITSVKYGKSRLITTTPKEFLASLAEEAE